MFRSGIESTRTPENWRRPSAKMLQRFAGLEDLKILGRKQNHTDFSPRSDRPDGFAVPEHFQPARVADLHLGFLWSSQRLGLARLEDAGEDSLTVAGGNREPSLLGGRQVQHDVVKAVGGGRDIDHWRAGRIRHIDRWRTGSTTRRLVRFMTATSATGC